GTSGDQALIEHWDGRAWSLVPSPPSGAPDTSLAGLAVIAPQDIWAVGTTYTLGKGATLVEHWDGRAWTIVPAPNPGMLGSDLSSVAAAGSDDVWAVGTTTNQGGPIQTLVEHWDGATWQVVPSPNRGPIVNHLLDVAVVTPDDVWAAGNYFDGATYQTVVE